MIFRDAKHTNIAPAMVLAFAGAVGAWYSGEGGTPAVPFAAAPEVAISQLNPTGGVGTLNPESIGVLNPPGFGGEL